jgi:hypothetical protein
MRGYQSAMQLLPHHVDPGIDREGRYTARGVEFSTVINGLQKTLGLNTGQEADIELNSIQRLDQR